MLSIDGETREPVERGYTVKAERQHAHNALPTSHP